MLIHRFASADLIKFKKVLKDDATLRETIARGQRNSNSKDVKDFLTVLRSQFHDISLLLGPIAERARKVSGGMAIANALRTTTDFLMTEVDIKRPSSFLKIQHKLSRPSNAAENAVMKITAVPLAKVWVYSNYDMSLHEVPSTASSSGYRVELRLYSSDGAQVIAASDWQVATRGAPKLRTKDPAGASV